MSLVRPGERLFIVKGVAAVAMSIRGRLMPRPGLSPAHRGGDG